MTNITDRYYRPISIVEIFLVKNPEKSGFEKCFFEYSIAKQRYVKNDCFLARKELYFIS